MASGTVFAGMENLTRQHGSVGKQPGNVGRR
jgi:hypothetical protein